MILSCQLHFFKTDSHKNHCISKSGNKELDFVLTALQGTPQAQ